jgi:hypothetical protein
MTHDSLSLKNSNNQKISKITIKDTRFKSSKSYPETLDNQKKLNQDDAKVPIYNTYLINGLPQASICNPSKKTILAVANFEKTEMMFFVWNEKSCIHEFSVDFKSHKEKKFQKFQKTNKESRKVIKNKLQLHKKKIIKKVNTKNT